MPSNSKPTYKLHYFDVRGRGDVIRQLFSLAGQEFEDYRIPLDFAKFAKIKKNYQFGQVPVLEVNGQPLSQEYAIIRYLANKFGFAGKDDWEKALVDAYADQIKDFFNAQVNYWKVGVVGISPGDPEEAKKLFLTPAIEQHFPLFVKAIEENESGYIVGKHFTWVDLYLSELFNSLANKNPELVTQYPAIAGLRDKIHSIPRIKQFREKHPTDF